MPPQATLTGRIALCACVSHGNGACVSSSSYLGCQLCKPCAGSQSMTVSKGHSNVRLVSIMTCLLRGFEICSPFSRSHAGIGSCQTAYDPAAQSRAQKPAKYEG